MIAVLSEIILILCSNESNFVSSLNSIYTYIESRRQVIKLFVIIYFWYTIFPFDIHFRLNGDKSWTTE